MKTLLLSLFLLAGQVPNIGGDPVELSKDEIKRRGNMVEPMGEIAGDNDAKVIADALRPPERDDDKWHLTIITDVGCQPCERLKYDFANNKEFRAWVNVSEPLKSPLHYQIRSIKDPTQRDWFAGIREEIELKNAYPAVVIQPPRNGMFGPCKTVVKILYGYDGNPTAYTDKMRDAIIVYVKKVRQARSNEGANDLPKLSVQLRNAFFPVSGNVNVIGQQPTPATRPIGGPPPFQVQPQQPLQTPNDWPNTPAPTMTITDIQRLLPNAPAEFVLQMNSAGVKDPATLHLHWQVFQSKNPVVVPVAPQQPFCPAQPETKKPIDLEKWTTQQLMWLLGTIVHVLFQSFFLIAIVILIVIIRKDRAKIANLQSFQTEVNRRMNPVIPTATT